MSETPAGLHRRNDDPAEGPPRLAKRYALRGAEVFWYILGCISLASAYFMKIPPKKAACEVFSELQLDGGGPSSSYSLRGMEAFWYFAMCIVPPAGAYLVKVSCKKGLFELVAMTQASPDGYGETIGRALSGSVR